MPTIYRATNEFKCPAEVLCRELESLTNDEDFLLTVTPFGRVIVETRLAIRNRYSLKGFLRWLDALAAENACDDNLCPYCYADLNPDNLAWVEGEPVCTACAERYVEIKGREQTWRVSSRS